MLLWAHALSAALLFYLIGSMYERCHTRLFKYIKAALVSMPIWCMLFLAASLANMALPSTSNFVAELLIISSAYKCSLELSTLMALSMLFAGAYALWLYSRMALGAASSSFALKALDIAACELIALMPLLLALLLSGLMPNMLLNKLSLFAALCSLTY